MKNLSLENRLILRDEFERLRKINPEHKFISKELHKSFGVKFSEESIQEMENSPIDADLYDAVLQKRNLNLY